METHFSPRYRPWRQRLAFMPDGDLFQGIRGGQTLDFGDCWGHRGILFSGVPNMAWVFGYLLASWTMRADLEDGTLIYQ